MRLPNALFMISDVMTGYEIWMGRCKGNPCGCPDNGSHPYGWLGRCRGVLHALYGRTRFVAYVWVDWGVIGRTRTVKIW